MKYFDVGKIINTRGLKGEIKVFCFVDDISKFDLIKKIFIDNKEFKIERVSYKKKFVYLILEGINNIYDAENLKGKLIKIDADLAANIYEREYYRSNLYGMKVYDGNDFLGILVDIMKTGAHDIYVIKNNKFEKPKEILVPAVKNFILNVDFENKIMQVKLIKGMHD